MEESFTAALKKRLREIRKAKRLTQTEVARAKGTTKAAVCRIERSPQLRLETFLLYCEALGVPVYLALDFTKEPREVAEMTLALGVPGSEFLGEIVIDTAVLDELMRNFVLEAAKNMSKGQMTITEFIDL